MSEGPLIVQSDKTALLEVNHPVASDARHDLAIFAELERAPEHIHTYRITKLGLWNARAAGHDSGYVLGVLDKYAKFAIPSSVRVDIQETMDRYGKLVIRRDAEGQLLLTCSSPAILLEASRGSKIAALLGSRLSEDTFEVLPFARGALKQELLKLGWPAEDLAAELLKRTTLTEEEIGEYSGSVKQVKPITIASYQILTAKRKGEYAHLELLNAKDWGLVIYDEVHLLPAPIFKMTADLQARRRLGLTATLVREDGKEGDVFSLIGPKRFDAPWKEIESEGYIAPAECFEIRVDLPEDERLNYAIAEQDERYRLAATSKVKIPVIQKLLQRHNGEPTLIIGQYLDQIDEVANLLGVPKITGETPVNERERLFQSFREGPEPTLVVSKVANFSVDLPEASVAIQISGSYGSRQEEAQRLGRLLRPKADGRTASFYTLIARDTVDQDFAQNRQRFLAEQGYSYKILDVSSI